MCIHFHIPGCHLKGRPHCVTNAINALQGTSPAFFAKCDSHIARLMTNANHCKACNDIKHTVYCPYKELQIAIKKSLRNNGPIGEE